MKFSKVKLMFEICLFLEKSAELQKGMWEIVKKSFLRKNFESPLKVEINEYLELN